MKGATAKVVVCAVYRRTAIPVTIEMHFTRYPHPSLECSLLVTASFDTGTYHSHRTSYFCNMSTIETPLCSPITNCMKLRLASMWAFV